MSARRRVLSLRLDDLEREQIEFAAATAGQSVADYARQALLHRADQTPICGTTRQGTWNATYAPVCQLPAYHRILHSSPHMWPHPAGDKVEVWIDVPEAP